MKGNIFINFKYVILDLDGTLFDSISLYHVRWCQFWKKFGVPKKISAKIYLLICNLETKHNAIGRFLEKILQKITKVKNENPILFPGVIEFLRKLVYGNKLFVSSGSFEAKKRLKKAGIDKYFTEILGAEQGSKEKHVQKIAEILDLPVHLFSRCLCYIADTPNDMKIARKYNFWAIGVANRFSKEDLLMAGADEIIEKIQDLLK